MRTLIIGKGQIGNALGEILKNEHKVFYKDIEDLELEKVEILNICYPDSHRFVEITRDYIAKYKPRLTIINSSVEVGTTEKCGKNVVYSPIRGRHVKFPMDLLRYDKFVFGENNEDINLAVRFFQDCGMTVRVGGKSKSGEFFKLISNVHMGLEIAWRQEVERMMKSFDLNSKDYEIWEESYRNGYFKSIDYHLVRPSMNPDPIGGHCIIPCTKILKSQFESKFLDCILESNENRKKEISDGDQMESEVAA